MGVYSQINLEEINSILNHYELGRAVDFTPTIAGISNSNFKVELESGKRVLLKISNDKTIEQLNNEQSILLVLEKYKFKYSLHPFKTILGKPIYQHKNFFGVVFPFIEGLPPHINLESIFEIGKALGQLHSLEIRKEDLESIRPHDLVGFGGESIKGYTETQECPEDFKNCFNELFPNKLQNIPYDIFPAGIIHGDLYFDNSLFRDQELMTLIDFEQAGRGRFILDLGIAISGSCLTEDKTNVDQKLMESFLAGYQTERKLLTIEQEYLKTAILVGFLSISLWRIKRFYEGQMDHTKRFNYRELLTRAKNFSNS